MGAPRGKGKKTRHSGEVFRDTSRLYRRKSRHVHSYTSFYLLGGGSALLDDAAGVFIPPSSPEALYKLGRLVNHPIDAVLLG